MRAKEHLEEAIREDPNYALAYAALSECYTYLAGTAIGEMEGFEKARENALKSIELDNKLAEGHASLAMIALQHDWDWEKTMREFKRAIELNPSYSTARMWYGVYLLVAKRSEEGISELRLAENLDPLSTIVKLNLAAAYYVAMRGEEAKSKLRELIELQSDNHLAYTALGLVFLQESRVQDALVELRKSVALGETHPGLGILGYAQAVAGKREQALETLTKLVALEQPGTSFETEKAAVYVGLGEIERALDLLEKAFEQKESWLLLSHGFPIFDPLKSNPRYIKLIEKMGLS
jgi:tetratricopeptide (TPR) repeat protein